MKADNLYLAKKSISKVDPYHIADANILNHDEDIFKKTDIERYSNFDLIITNSIGSESKEYLEVLDAYSDDSMKSTKSVIAFKNIDNVKRTMKKIIKKRLLRRIDML